MLKYKIYKVNDAGEKNLNKPFEQKIEKNDILAIEDVLFVTKEILRLRLVPFVRFLYRKFKYHYCPETLRTFNGVIIFHYHPPDQTSEPFKNGLFFLSNPMVVSGPWPRINFYLIR